MLPNISLFLDKRRLKDDNTYPVKLRIWDPASKRARLVRTDFNLTETAFLEVTSGKRVGREFKELKLRLEGLLARANEIASGLTPFSFHAFETRLNGSTGDSISVVFQYEAIIENLKKYSQIGTASTYDLSLKSLIAFSKYKQKGSEKHLTFYDITPDWLQEYEHHSIRIQGKSKTTVSIYLRALRAVFNKAIASNEIKAEYYPFGSRKYQPPAVSKVKKALSGPELKILFESKPQRPEQEKSKDFWFFSYMCNGMNIKDIALLKFKDIDNSTIQFYRAKTINTNKGNLRPITIFLNDFSLGVIQKYGQSSKYLDEYVFNIVNSNMTPEQERLAIQNFTRFINQHIKMLCASLDLPEISTYWARHSFATMSIRNGASMELIQESLGHGNLKTTMNYFAGFEKKAKEELSKKLLEF